MIYQHQAAPDCCTTYMCPLHLNKQHPVRTASEHLSPDALLHFHCAFEFQVHAVIGDVAFLPMP